MAVAHLCARFKAVHHLVWKLQHSIATVARQPPAGMAAEERNMKKESKGHAGSCFYSRKLRPTAARLAVAAANADRNTPRFVNDKEANATLDAGADAQANGRVLAGRVQAAVAALP